MKTRKWTQNATSVLGRLGRYTWGLGVVWLCACGQGDAPPTAAGGSLTGPVTEPPSTTPEVSPVPSDCTLPTPGPSPLRRLSNFEYQNTLADLTGSEEIAARVSSKLVREPTSLGFRNSASALTIPPLLAEQYVQVAIDVAHQAMDLPGWFPCSTEVIDRECTQHFVEDFGKRAYRRPLTQSELQRYSNLYNAAIEQEADYRKAVEWVVSTMLSSSHFLFRVELDPSTGSVSRTNGFEMAQRLSYLLWQTMPDAELFSAAETGELDTTDGVIEQAKRLLADPKAYRVYEFFEQWLDLDELPSLTRDKTLYPEFSPALRERFRAETQMFIYDLLANGGTLEDLFAADYTFADAMLAAHYGLSTEGLDSNFVKVPAPGRSGVLTQARLLVHDHPASSSIVRRGLKVRTELLCQIVPAPPADVDVTPPVIDGEVSQRQRLEEHRSEPSCSGCHALMDPIGTIFEGFDALGRPRTHDEGGAAIVAGGELQNARDSNGSYEDPPALGTALAQSEQVQECVVRQAFRFFYGRDLEAADTCTQKQILSSFAQRNFRLDDLVLSLALTDQFLFRTSDVEQESNP